MKHDIENIGVILEYCDGILATRDLYGDDIEDFIENLQYQWSTAFGILQIGEAVKKTVLRTPGKIQRRTVV